MKITRRQLRRIIRETIEQDAADHYAEYPEGLPDPRSKKKRWRLGVEGYKDGLAGRMPRVLARMDDPVYKAGYDDGAKERREDPYSEDNIAQPV